MVERHRGEKFLNKVIFVFFAYKKYSCHFVMLRLNLYPSPFVCYSFPTRLQKWESCKPMFVCECDGAKGNYIVWSCEWVWFQVYICMCVVSPQGRGTLGGRVTFLKRVFPSTSVCWCVCTLLLDTVSQLLHACKISEQLLVLSHNMSTHRLQFLCLKFCLGKSPIHLKSIGEMHGGNMGGAKGALGPLGMVNHQQKCFSQTQNFKLFVHMVPSASQCSWTQLSYCIFNLQNVNVPIAVHFFSWMLCHNSTVGKFSSLKNAV